MGKQSKLKQKRQDLKQNPSQPLPPEVDQDPTHFVDKMEKQGYQLKQANRCPDVPERQDGRPTI